MKKREVKAFDIKEFNTKEEVIAEIERIENLDKADKKRVERKDLVLGGVMITTLAAGVISLCLAIGSLFATASNNIKMKSIANTMTLLDGYEEIYKEDAANLINQYADGKLTKKEFEKELQNLEKHEYVRSVAPEFCPESIIFAYDEAAHATQQKANRAATTAIIAGANALTFVGAGVLSSNITHKRSKRHFENTDNLSELYYKKEEIEEKEQLKEIEETN